MILEVLAGKFLHMFLDIQHKGINLDDNALMDKMFKSVVVSTHFTKMVRFVQFLLADCD